MNSEVINEIQNDFSVNKFAVEALKLANIRKEDKCTLLKYMQNVREGYCIYCDGMPPTTGLLNEYCNDLSKVGLLIHVNSGFSKNEALTTYKDKNNPKIQVHVIDYLGDIKLSDKSQHLVLKLNTVSFAYNKYLDTI